MTQSNTPQPLSRLAKRREERAIRALRALAAFVAEGASISDAVNMVAARFNLNPVTIYRWRKRYADTNIDDDPQD